jgi:hypothetical protein
MQELNIAEIEEVSGAGFWETVGYALGFATGSGAAMQQHIASMDNPMLGAMALGA